MKPLLKCYICSLLWITTPAWALNDDQTTSGTCSPAIRDVQGNITINCQGLSDGATKTLNEVLNKVGEVKELTNLVLEKLGKLDKIERDLVANQGLASELVTLNQEKRKLEGDIKSLQSGLETAKLKAAEEWATKYHELEKRLAEEIGEELAEQAQQALEQGQLDKAGQLLDQLIKKREQQVEKAATAHYLRAQTFELQYQPLQALPHLEKAYRYRPENAKYAHAYAVLLQKPNQHTSAITVYEQNLLRFREKGNKSDVAMTLNNLGILYSGTQRLKEGEANYQEALTIYRDLAKASPQAYLSDVAMTLHNFGLLLYFTQDKATQAHLYFKEEAMVRRELWKAHPELYADKFVASLALNALTLTQEVEETRCALLTEALQVAGSEEFKRAIMAEDVKQGAGCKLHNLILK